MPATTAPTATNRAAHEGRLVTVVLFDGSENEVEHQTFTSHAEAVAFAGGFVATMGLDPEGDSPMDGSVAFWPGTYEDGR